jgi:hypothetical protein
VTGWGDGQCGGGGGRVWARLEPGPCHGAAAAQGEAVAAACGSGGAAGGGGGAGGAARAGRERQRRERRRGSFPHGALAAASQTLSVGEQGQGLYFRAASTGVAAERAPTYAWLPTREGLTGLAGVATRPAGYPTHPWGATSCSAQRLPTAAPQWVTLERVPASR